MLLSPIIFLALFRLALAYPYYNARVQEPNDWQDTGLWSQPQPRPEYELSYGYPDYGDYGDQRPAYSEMDILREQLARSEPPFNKRLPPMGLAPPPAWEQPASLAAAAAAAAPPPSGTWYDRELPLQNQVEENERLKELTEALMEALAQQIEESKSRARLEAAAVELENSVEEEQEPLDLVVEELRGAVKKATGPVEASATTTSSPSVDSSPVSASSTPGGAAEEEKAAPSNVPRQGMEGESTGQKEIPMLRPRGRGAKSLWSARTRDMAPEGRRDVRSKLPLRLPRRDSGRQAKSIVTREDDLTQELDNLKKKSH